MAVDKTSTPTYVNIVVTDSEDHLKLIRERAITNDNGTPEKPELTISDEDHAVHPSEFYFDSDTNELYLNFSMTGGMVNGTERMVWTTIRMPMSDDVMIDLMAHYIKKFNKLKTVMESLK